MMMDKLLLLVLCGVIWKLAASQIHFPNDYPVYNTNNNYQTSSRLNEDGDASIPNGIAKFTLAMAKLMPQHLDAVVYSPTNIAGALSLVLLGANGRTFDELARVLHLKDTTEIDTNSQKVHERIGGIFDKLRYYHNPDEVVKIATGIFMQEDYEIRDVYRELCKRIYDSDIIKLNFQNNANQAKNFINNWIASNTNNKITNILQDDPPSSTKIIITSALYFKAAWEKPFFEGFTKQRPFYPDGRKSDTFKMVDMMSNGGSFPYFRDPSLSCEVMGFPYKGNKATMYVVIPFHSNKQKLLELQSRLTADELERLVQSTRLTHAVVAFPKMTLESTLDLGGVLQDLGAKSLFNPYTSNLGVLAQKKSSNNQQPMHLQQPQADQAPIQSLNSKIHSGAIWNHDLQSGLIFSRMGEETNSTGDYNNRRKRRQIQQNLDTLRASISENDNPGLYADQVLHKVFMEVTETGTEAAAATSVSLSRGGDITTFRADIPFLFFIRSQDTKMILFWGTVFTPTPSFS